MPYGAALPALRARAGIVGGGRAWQARRQACNLPADSHPGWVDAGSSPGWVAAGDTGGERARL